MCVMSLSVMAYHSDRNLAASVKMMEVGVGSVGAGARERRSKSSEERPGRRGRGYCKVTPEKGRVYMDETDKSLSILTACCEWASVPLEHIQLTH